MVDSIELPKGSIAIVRGADTLSLSEGEYKWLPVKALQRDAQQGRPGRLPVRAQVIQRSLSPAIFYSADQKQLEFIHTSWYLLPPTNQ